jgi:two-component system OmpR family response regulator
VFSILIVDDNPDLVDLFDLVLTRKGYRTLKAAGGEECLKILKSDIPNLTLLDIMMTPMDGWETLQQIKNDARTSSVPVIMLTGKPPTSGEVIAHMNDIEDYVIKPVTMQELSELVQAFFTRQETINRECIAAKVAGADTAFLDEYQRIRRSLNSGKTMLKLIGYEKEPVEKEIKDREKRLEVLRQQYRITGSSG